MPPPSLELQVLRLGEKQEVEKLRELINNTSTKELIATLTAKLPRSDCINFWNYLLLGCDIANFEAREKRFACVQCFLNGLRSIELSYKQSYDLITRLCQDLPTFSTNELGEILEHCLDDMRAGDAKCVGWKDLLPEALAVLAAKPQLTINGITMIGTEYRDNTLRNLCTMRWPSTVLTPIADMFKELRLSSAEHLTVLNKFAGALQELSPMELPALSYQLFSMCSTAAQLVVPLMALEKYFHRNYYKRLFSEMSNNSTDFDSIDPYSDKELREAEETVLHHLNYCTMYKLSEQQVCIMLRNFLHMPDVILTPFMLSAIISMTAANREPEAARLSFSILLPFVRSVIKHNQDESALADYSVWCRDTLQRKQVDLDQVFGVLIDQNKDGKDVITPGLVNLAFVLLKAKQSPSLNALAMSFLTKFIRKRFIFGQGIIKRIVEWMIVDQEQNQFSECLTMLSVADTFTVSECQKTILTVMGHFPWLPGEQSMRMMSFILPLLKISNAIRDALIEVLRKAMNASDVSVRRMAVYGFCMILKQLNNSNSLRQSQGGSSFCTQQSISGFSIMTQCTLGSRSNPQRNFDMLTLEIIGTLRGCLQQPLEIRRTLYENLQRAVELNAKLVPHVLQFIDWHFRSYIDTPSAEATTVDDMESEFSVRYAQLVSAKDEQHMELELKDNLGNLVQFLAHCLAIFERAPNGYDVREMQRLLSLCTQRIAAHRLTFEDTSAPATHLKFALLHQQLNLIEGIIAHLVLSSKPSNDVIRQVLPLFKQHHKLLEGIKSLASSAKKSQKRGKLAANVSDINATAANLTINGVRVKRIETQPENIWDLAIVDRLLHLLHDDNVPFAAAEHTTQLRAHVELVRYVLEVAAHKVEAIRLEPDYKQLAYSKRTLKHLTDIAKVIYERCIRRLPALWRDFDLATAALAAQCFLQCLRTAHETYKKRFREFVKGFDMPGFDKNKEAIYVLQDVIDEFMQEDASEQCPEEAIGKDALGKQLPICLLQALEILYDHIGFEDRATSESYNWLLSFCRTYELPSGELSFVHRLLFTQRQKTHAGAFFDGVARQLGELLGAVKDDNEDDEAVSDELRLKSISLTSAEGCLQHLYAALRKQLDDVEYFVVKANNLNYKCRIVAEEDRVYWRGNLDALDRSICTQLIHVSKTLLELTNVCIPLGACMDGLMRLLIQHYTCLNNLAKHYLACCATKTVSIQSTKIELLLRVVGKPLPSNVYELIKYIETNILDEHADQPKKRNPQAEKAKVLRETKLIPKVILGIENFNKHIIMLSKKKHDRLANYLHFGTVRDFRIKTADLKAAIERTYSHSKEIEVVDSNLGEHDDKDTDTNASVEARIEAESQRLEDEAGKTPEAEADAQVEEEEEQENVEQPRKSLRRRRVLSSDAEESPPKRRRGRAAKK